MGVGRRGGRRGTVGKIVVPFGRKGVTMATVAEAVATSERPTKGRPRRVIVAAVAIVTLVVAGLTTVFALRHQDLQYGPIEDGSFAGPYSQHDMVVSKDGFSPRLAAIPGATAELIESITNRGAHSVKITSIDTDQIVTSVRWSRYQTVPGGNVDGEATTWHRFPAIVPGHDGIIRLLVTIHRPSYCAAQTAGGDVFYTGEHVVHWESLLTSHTTAISYLEPIVRLC
jgi:hypothetical protein